MIGVIDYKAGNAPSVLNALLKIGAQAKLVRSAQELAEVKGIILPGVGSADATILSLESDELLDAVQEKVLMERVPFLGICVGLQILFEHSEEDRYALSRMASRPRKRISGHGPGAPDRL